MKSCFAVLSVIPSFKGGCLLNHHFGGDILICLIKLPILVHHICLRYGYSKTPRLIIILNTIVSRILNGDTIITIIGDTIILYKYMVLLLYDIYIYIYDIINVVSYIQIHINFMIS